MPNRSSIFSFDTLQALPWRSRSVVLATGIVLLSITAMEAFRDAFMVRDPTSRVANSIRYLRSQEPRGPRVLFLGSSRTESCIDVETFARESGIPADTVLNLAEPDMVPWHALVVVRHAPNALSHVETVFVELAPQPFNDNARDPLTYESDSGPREFDAWATCSERMRARGMGARCGLLAEYVVPVSQRRSLIDWLMIGKAILRQEPWEGGISGPIYHRDAGKAAALARDPRFQARTISQHHLHDFYFSDREATAFRELLALLRKRGIEVVIFHPPVRAEYFDYLASHPEIQGEFDKFRGFVRELAGEHRVVYWETLADCGLDDSAVVDYGHFSRDGALRFTRRLYAATRTGDRTIPSVTKSQTPASGAPSIASREPSRL